MEKQMEQFKKWSKKQNTTQYEGKECRDTWKAALEWALEQDTWIGSDENGEWGIDKDEIKGELRGEEG